MPKLISQQTQGGNGQKVEKWTIEVDAVNGFLAKQRARAYARRQAPTARNVFSPDQVGKGETEQSTFNQIFPESIQMERYRVEILVVMDK